MVCKDREVPSNYGFFCTPVSPLCLDYDRLTGSCKSCQDPASLLEQGKCLKQVVSPLAGCLQRQKLGQGKCLNVILYC